MSTEDIDRYTTQHVGLIQDYVELSCAEDRLAWLMERPALHPPVAVELCTPERRVPGCLSGLWLNGSVKNDYCFFSARSESSMVQGVVSYLCDLHSGRLSDEVMSLGSSLVEELKLEGVLSITRRRAVESALRFFQVTAQSRRAV